MGYFYFLTAQALQVPGLPVLPFLYSIRAYPRSSAVKLFLPISVISVHQR